MRTATFISGMLWIHCTQDMNVSIYAVHFELLILLKGVCHNVHLHYCIVTNRSSYSPSYRWSKYLCIRLLLFDEPPMRTKQPNRTINNRIKQLYLMIGIAKLLANPTLLLLCSNVTIFNLSKPSNSLYFLYDMYISITTAFNAFTKKVVCLRILLLYKRCFIQLFYG